MIAKPDTSTMRFRTPSLLQTTDAPFYKWTNTSDGRILEAQLSHVVVARKSTTMHDVTIPNYHKRSAQGEIFNNPMIKTKELLSYPLIPLSGGDNKYTLVAKSHFKTPTNPTRLTPDDIQLAIDKSIVQAYGNVTANEGNTILWLGELKETISMLFDIKDGVLALFEKTKKQRKKWAKGKLTIEEAQQLTLQLLYGVMPLEQQITDFYDGLFRTKNSGERHTARGIHVIKNNRVINETGRHKVFNDHYANYTFNGTASSEVVARAGVLFDIDIETPWLAIILEPKSVLSTAYALARLSFVIDWFIDIGGTIAAWSPSIGTKPLTAWVTVTETSHVTGTYLAQGPLEKDLYGSGDFEHLTETKWRVPISRADLPVFPIINVDLDVDKLFAMILLFAKVKKDL